MFHITGPPVITFNPFEARRRLRVNVVVMPSCPQCGRIYMGSDGRPCLQCEMPELGPILDAPIVFWVCPDHPGGRVQWQHIASDPGGVQSIATCSECGRSSIMITEQTPVATAMPKCCETCVWIHRFEPREDEKRRDLVIGCKKPGFEGYSSLFKMACDGVFWSPDRSA